MSVKTYLQIVQENSFRSFVSNRIAKETMNPFYSFPASFPLLYRYRGLSDYAISDIMNNKITLTTIGDFNDLYDGAIHRYGTKEDIDAEVERKMYFLTGTLEKANVHIQSYFDSIKRSFEDVARRDSKLSFRVLDYLGTYVCCFSESNSSTLMWAHYAANNQGICIEYDFNKLPYPHLYRETLFPVAYADRPCRLDDLVSKEIQHEFKYPYDAAVLCAALTKSSIWKYEKEWRLVHVLEGIESETHRMVYNAIIQPSSICFGYHFLRPLFYFANTNSQGKQAISKKIENLVKLLEYMGKSKIEAKVIRPRIGEYSLVPIKVETIELLRLINQHFHDNSPENIRFYYVVHDQLMRILEGENYA